MFQSNLFLFLLLHPRPCHAYSRLHIPSHAFNVPHTHDFSLFRPRIKVCRLLQEFRWVVSCESLSLRVCLLPRLRQEETPWGWSSTWGHTRQASLVSSVARGRPSGGSRLSIVVLIQYVRGKLHDGEANICGNYFFFSSWNCWLDNVGESRVILSRPNLYGNFGIHELLHFFIHSLRSQCITRALPAALFFIPSSLPPSFRVHALDTTTLTPTEHPHFFRHMFSPFRKVIFPSLSLMPLSPSLSSSLSSSTSFHSCQTLHFPLPSVC